MIIGLLAALLSPLLPAKKVCQGTKERNQKKFATSAFALHAQARNLRGCEADGDVDVREIEKDNCDTVLLSYMHR